MVRRAQFDFRLILLFAAFGSEAQEIELEALISSHISHIRSLAWNGRDILASFVEAAPVLEVLCYQPPRNKVCQIGSDFLGGVAGVLRVLDWYSLQLAPGTLEFVNLGLKDEALERMIAT